MREIPVGVQAFLPMYGNGGGEVGKVTRCWLWEDEALPSPTWMVEIDGHQSGEICSAFVMGDVCRQKGEETTWRIVGFTDDGAVALSGPGPCRGITSLLLTTLGSSWEVVNQP
jgi:hypothetical protein